MRIVRIIGFGLGGLVALALIVILAVALLLNPNDYKDRIIHQVKAATGRDLALPGAIKLSVFPWIALELGPARLGNPAGFPGEEFLSVEHVALRVKLLPLLRRNLQIGRIEIDQLDLHLLKNAAGKGNWEDFGNHEAAPATDSGGAGGPHDSIFQSLAGIIIRNSHVSYNTVSVADLNLEIGNVAQQALVPVSLRFRLERGADAPSLPIVVSSPSVALDLAAQTLNATSVRAQIAAAILSGAVRGEQVLGSPVISGQLTLEPVDLRALMAQLGMRAPVTRDAQAYSRFSAKTDFRYAGRSAELPTLEAQLDDSHLKGSVSVTDLDTRATRFALVLDHIDIDRYRAPLGKVPAIASDAAPAALPGATLRTLEAQGTFVIGSAKFSAITLSDVNLTLQAHAGLIQLAPLKSRLYGGQYSATIGYDVRGEVPQLQLDQQLTGVDMTPLLKDAVDSHRLSGHGNSTMTLTGHGLDSDALMKSLSGRLELHLQDGAIEGADLGYEIGIAQALLKRQSLPATANTHHTKFDSFKVSAAITGGIARTDDLTIGTPYLRITGQGTTNLLSKALDLKLVATVLKAPGNAAGTDLSDLTLAAIPVAITGTATEPKVRPDLQGIVKSQLQQKARDLLKDKLNDRLKGLFGR